MGEHGAHRNEVGVRGDDGRSGGLGPLLCVTSLPLCWHRAHPLAGCKRFEPLPAEHLERNAAVQEFLQAYHAALMDIFHTYTHRQKELAFEKPYAMGAKPAPDGKPKSAGGRLNHTSKWLLSASMKGWCGAPCSVHNRRAFGRAHQMAPGGARC